MRSTLLRLCLAANARTVTSVAHDQVQLEIVLLPELNRQQCPRTKSPAFCFQSFAFGDQHGFVEWSHVVDERVDGQSIVHKL